MSCGFPIDVHGSLRPCGKCQGCLRRRRRGWVARMLAEGGSLGDSSFVTLTYDDAHLPLTWSHDQWIPTLEKSHARNWLRSVRRKATANGLPKRFFMAGEYGSKTGRPHLHCILFGIGPNYESLFGPKWEHGFQSWYLASAKSMAYVAKYCLKHGRDPELELGVEPEQRKSLEPFRLMSRNPPIGFALVDAMAKELARPGRPDELLEREKFLKGIVRIDGDKYPVDRTMKLRLDHILESDYALDEVTRGLMLGKETEYQPTEGEIRQARQAHQVAVAKGRTRHKL